MFRTFETTLSGRKVVVETGKMAGLANGSALVRFGDTVVLATADGQEIYRTTTSAFPLPMNVAGITGAESGLVTFFYYVDLPATTTTDENGNVVTIPGGREERNLSRSVKFAKE